ncbi:DUF6879 family protein [Kitasatospora sp. NPDC057541]|uniref:DUF6879 family protein n=1 Tax=unclassified Kitasatospora TaxID=2633591 RepID=UPI0036974439
MALRFVAKDEKSGDHGSPAASDLLLPGNDFWLFDGKIVQFNIFDGDGRWVHTDQSDDPAVARNCAAAFDAVWERAVPHEAFSIAE